MLPLLAMSLGGAALGALANKKDRKKGALMGLGLGLLGPMMAGGMGVGAAGAGTGVASGITNAAPLAKGAGMFAKASNAAATGFGKVGAALTSEGMKGAAKQTAISSAPVLLQSAMQETPAPQPGRSLAMDNRAAGAPVDLYAQAAINRQQRMKRGLPGRRLS
jgi:hypothetical protein